MIKKASRWLVLLRGHPAGYTAASWRRKLTTGAGAGNDSEVMGLRRTVEGLKMAIEGYDWVDASADAAYLECDATQRGPRAQFKLDAVHAACAQLERALSDAGNALDGDMSGGTALSLDNRIFIARLMSEGHSRLHRLQSNAKVVEQRLLNSPTPVSCNHFGQTNNDDQYHYPEENGRKK